jgi:mRNA interferase MazF
VEYLRTSIWFANLPMQEENNGVQQGGRPVIITQNDIGNLHSTTVTVIVGTKRQKKDMPTHVKLDTRCGLKEETIFMAEQQMTINKSQLMFYIGMVPGNKMNEVDRAIKIQAGLIEPFNIGYVREIIDSIMAIDSLYSSETNKIYKIREIQIKELDRYCSEFGYDYETLLNKHCRERGVMCG